MVIQAGIKVLPVEAVDQFSMKLEKSGTGKNRGQGKIGDSRKIEKSGTVYSFLVLSMF